MKKYTSSIAALLLVLCAVWNIRCESDKLEKQRQQAHKFCEQQNVQQYLHINSKPYKQSLKQDTLFALRLDSIDKERIDSIERQAKVLKVTWAK